MKRVFTSLLNPSKYGYIYDTEAYDYQAQVSDHFRMFETYGDGQIQHSRDWPITLDFMTDYLASLATAMLKDSELCERASYDFSGGCPSKDDIAFAAGIVFKESDRSWSKQRFYSVSERKVSSSASKEHDKRFEKIAEWNDGSADATYRMLHKDYYRGIQKYALAESVREYRLANNGGDMELAACFLKWFDCNQERARQLRNAYRAVKDILESHRLRSNAESALGYLVPKAADSSEVAA